MASGGESHLDRLRQERHRRIFEHTPSGLPSIPKTPSGFRAEDFAGEAASEGFLSISDAASAMETTEARVIELARRGYLQAVARTGRLYIRPAIVNAVFVENERP
jgi:hypothetical protein